MNRVKYVDFMKKIAADLTNQDLDRPVWATYNEDEDIFNCLKTDRDGTTSLESVNLSGLFAYGYIANSDIQNELDFITYVNNSFGE